jgi:hypothetical protein
LLEATFCDGLPSLPNLKVVNPQVVTGPVMDVFVALFVNQALNVLISDVL